MNGRMHHFFIKLVVMSAVSLSLPVSNVPQVKAAVRFPTPTLNHPQASAANPFTREPPPSPTSTPFTALADRVSAQLPQTPNTSDDCVKPAVPIQYTPTNNSTISDTRPFFDWSDVANATNYHIAIQDMNDAYNYIFVQTDSSNYTPDVDLVDSDYEWLVFATNGSPGCSVNSDLSPTWFFTLDTNPVCVTPGIPQLIAPSNNSTVTDSRPHFDWNDVADATEYHILIQDMVDPYNFTFERTTTSQFTPSSDLVDSDYEWIVYATHVSDGCTTNGDFSATWYFTLDTTPPCVKPGVPQLISPPNGSVMSDKRPFFDWNDVSNATEYHIAIQDKNDAYNYIFEETTISEYRPSTDLVDSDYEWLVFASNTASGCNVNGDSSATWAFTLNAVPPPTPNLVSPANGSTLSDNTPTFTWLESVGAEQYHLEADNNANFSSPEVNVAPSTTSFTPSSSLANGTYYWRVRAGDHYGSWSNWSTVWSFTVSTLTPPPAPTLDEVLNDWTINYEVSWSAVASATSYELQENHDTTGWNTIFTGTNTRVTRYDRADGQWCYRVRAANAAGPGSWSNTQCATVDTTPPPIPNLISPANGATLSDNTPTFSWSSVTGAVGYIWTLDDDSSMQSSVDSAIVVGTSYTPSTPIPDGTYYWAVESFDAADNHSVLSTVRSLTISTASVPSAPTVNPISNPEWDGTYTVSWSSVSSATAYELQERLNSGSWSTSSLTGTSKNYSGKADGQWCYQVRAVNSAGPGSWSNLVCTIVDTTPPSPPTLISPSNTSTVSNSTPTFDWTDPSTATGYRLQVDDLSNFSSPQINVTPSSSSFTISSPLPDGDYFWRVQANDVAGNLSDWSTIWRFTIKSSSVVVDTGFRPNPDGYSFINYGVANYDDFTIDDMRIMFGDDAVCNMVDSVCQPLSVAVDWNKWVNDMMWGGHCDGFTTTSLRFFKQIEDPASYQAGAVHTYDLSIDNARRHIAYYWALQVPDPVKTARYSALQYTPNQVLQQIIASLSYGAPDPPDLIIYARDFSLGHSIAPYAVVDKGNGTYWVRVYDNNAPNRFDYYVEFDTVKNTWNYGWTGDAYSHNIGIIPLSVYAQPAVCPWCTSSNNQIMSSTTSSISIYSQDRVLIEDEFNRQIGYVNDELVNEIPDAYASAPVGGLGIYIQPVYTLPSAGAYTISLSGSSLAKTEGSSTTSTKILQFGSGYAVTIDNVDLTASSTNKLNITSDGSSVTFLAGSAVEPTIKMDASTPGNDQAFEVRGADIGAGQQMAISVDTGGQKLVVDNSKTSGGSYDLRITKQDSQGSHTFSHQNITVSAADTQFIDYSTVNTTDTITVSVDHGSNGTIDDTVTLENETIKVYLPLVIRK
jgi:hypothetical protein